MKGIFHLVHTKGWAKQRRTYSEKVDPRLEELIRAEKETLEQEENTEGKDNVKGTVNSPPLNSPPKWLKMC